MEITEVIRRGIITEESVRLQNLRPTQGNDAARSRVIPRYTFQVHPDATKYQVRLAVEQLFGVKVVKVNTLTMPGKARTLRTRKGFFRKEARPWKKAVVTLADGETIAELQA